MADTREGIAVAFDKIFFNRFGYSVLLLLALCVATPSFADGSDSDTIKITLLGTGTPPVSTTQFGASTLVEAGGQALIFDCGRGCGIRLMQAQPELYAKINHLFLTHMHSDHMVGVPDIYMNGWLLGRSATFHVYGPRGTKKFMTGLRKAFEPDVYTRYKLERFPQTVTGLALDISETRRDGIIYDNDGLRVTAFTVDHAEAKPAFGYRIDYRGRSVMLSGDTKLTGNLESYGKDVDVIVQEVIPPSLIKRLAELYPSDQVQKIVDHHTLAEQAGKLFAATKPRLAVYSHYNSTPKSDAYLLVVTRQDWQGPVEAGEDLMTITVGDRRIEICRQERGCKTVDAGN